MLCSVNCKIGRDYLRAEYFGLFQYHVSYGLLLWGHSSNVLDVILLQKEIIWILARVRSLERCWPYLFVSLKICTVGLINLYIIYTKTNLHLFNTRKILTTTTHGNRLTSDIPHFWLLGITSNSFKINSVKLLNNILPWGCLDHFC